MTNEITHPFTVGLEVALVSYSGWDSAPSYRNVKVSKVLKNNKIKIEGSDKQWRVYSRPDSYNPIDGRHNQKWAASEVNPDRGLRNSPNLELITDALIARVLEAHRLRANKSKINVVIDLLEKNRSSGNLSDEQVEALDQVILKFNTQQS